MNNDERVHDRNLEFRRLLHDSLKHLATLSTGSVLLIVAFLEKLNAQPTWTWAVAVAIVSFALCILASVVAQMSSLDTLGEADEPGEIENLTGFSLLACWICFLFGIAFLVAFGVRNVL